MASEQILGFFTMWLHPEITIALWSKAGVPIWQTFLYAAGWTSLVLIIAYCGIGWLKRFIKKSLKNRKGINRTIQKATTWYDHTKSRMDNGPYSRRVTKWVARQKNWIILMCGFIPFVYGLPATVIVTAKLLEIKWALPVLILGNLFRNAIICGLIYGTFNFFS
jgi:membrane protein implicated in regulation of membrane protease activity